MTASNNKQTESDKSSRPVELRNLLAINFGGIGDEILFLPTLKSLRESYPQAKITLLVEPRSQSIKQVTDLIDNIVCFDIKKRPLTVFDMLQLLNLLKVGNYDCVLSSGSSWMVSALLYLSKIKVRVGYGTTTLSKKLLTNPVPLNQAQYAANMYHNLVTGLGLPRADVVPKIILKPDRMREMGKLLNPLGTDTAISGIKRVLIHPGTSRLSIQKGIVKTWSVDNWIQLIRNILNVQRLEVVLAGGPDDEEIVGQILAGLNSAPNLRSFFGHTKSLSDLAALIELCDLLVCVDSAPMHLAVGLHKPVVAMFGPTDPKKLVPQSDEFKHSNKVLKSSASPGVLGVQLPPENVFRSVLDLLQATKAPGYSKTN